MSRLLTLAALAPACAFSSPAFAMAYPPEWGAPGDPGRSMATALLWFGVVSVGVGLLPAPFVSRRPPAVLAAIMALAVMVLVPLAAHAQGAAPSGAILNYGWGDAANGLFKVAIEAILPVAGAAITFAAGYLPWWVRMIVTTQRIDRALATGAAYALNAVEGATAGKSISVDVGYAVLKVALERILGSTPAWLIKEMGGPKGISERLFRVFHFDETVSDANTLAPLVRALPTFPFAK